MVQNKLGCVCARVCVCALRCVLFFLQKIATRLSPSIPFFSYFLFLFQLSVPTQEKFIEYGCATWRCNWVLDAWKRRDQSCHWRGASPSDLPSLIDNINCHWIMLHILALYSWSTLDRACRTAFNHLGGHSFSFWRPCAYIACADSCKLFGCYPSMQ